MRSLRRLTGAASVLTIAIMCMSIGVSQPPGPPGDGGSENQLQPCNGERKYPYLLGERCQLNNGNCPSWNPNMTGGGCHLFTTVAGKLMFPMLGDYFCGEGLTPGDHCVGDEKQPVPCLYAYVCAATAVPNPYHDPEDPSSPVIITICALGPRGAEFKDRLKPIEPDCILE